MHGKIKFYNEEKSFGMIVKDNVDYFFHKSDIVNMPDKICENDIIKSFDVLQKQKGPAAKKIVFEEKVLCPVCNWTNTESDEKCTNHHCGFTLQYAKGLHTEISDEELQAYKKSLQEAKKRLSSSKKEVASKNQTSSKLDGKIIAFDEIEGTGLIRGSDALKYTFNIEDTNKPLEIKVGESVKFNTYSSKLIAIKIMLTKNNEKEDTKLKINNETILIQHVVSYKLQIDTIEIDRYKDCDDCDGSGDCYDCNGSGDCKHCHGSGNCDWCIDGEGCHRCNFSGDCDWCVASGDCDECEGSGYCDECEGSCKKYAGQEFKKYDYFIKLKFSNATNRKIYIGSWNNEESKENNKIYFYGKKIIDKLDSLC